MYDGVLCVCVCVAGNQISDAGAKELAEALETNCALQTLFLQSKCREDASIGTACGTERGMVCVSGCGGVVTSTHETLSGLTYVCVCIWEVVRGNI